MENIQVFVEGKSDVKFLRDYISHIFNSDIPVQFEKLGGIDKDINFLKKSTIPFKRNTDDNGINLLIIDANGDIEKRKSDAMRLSRELDIKFELFLLPNNEEGGNLETLLCKIINERYQLIFDCFESYKTCLETGGYRAPGLKSKVFAYLETLYEDESDKRLQYEYRDYLNPDHWDVNHPYLDPLKEFFLANIRP